MKLSKLMQKANKTSKVTLDCGVTVEVKENLNMIEFMQVMEEKKISLTNIGKDSKSIRALIAIAEVVIASWDLVDDDGKEVEVTQDVFQFFSLQDITNIVNACKSLQATQDEQKKSNE